MSLLSVRGVRVLGVHGVLDEERGRPQPFEFDLDVHFDMTRAAESDALEDTVDYASVVDAAVGVMKGEHRNLLERLAKLIGDAVLDADHRITRVDVELRKTRPPVGHDFASAGVHLTVNR
jgi:dihydroneopterin aldolase